MTQEEKQLLLGDLCARLPYGVICKLSAKDADVSITEKLDFGGLEHFISGTMDIKPFLRPMSSMTEEEINDLVMHVVDGPIIYDEDTNLIIGFECNTFEQFALLENWLNAHHFDYRGLIEMGLALEAPEGMYKIR